jgi:hypothetical protein
LLLLPDPINENPNNSPIILINNLNSRRAEIQKFIPRLDPDPFLNMLELPIDMPNYYNPPTFDSAGVDWLQIKVHLNDRLNRQKENYISILYRC